MIVILTIAFALNLSYEAYQLHTPLCFTDSYGSQITGRPADAAACRTTVRCPPLLTCHGGKITGLDKPKTSPVPTPKAAAVEADDGIVPTIEEPEEDEEWEPEWDDEEEEEEEEEEEWHETEE